MKHDSDRLEPIIDEAVNAIHHIFTSNEHTDNDVAAARIASSVLATWSKLKQSERSQEAIYFAMARELAEDKDQLEKYIALTLPDVPIVKMLDAKKLPAPRKVKP